MNTQVDQERCHECNRDRKYHTPRCEYETETERCPCPRFSTGELSARTPEDTGTDK